MRKKQNADYVLAPSPDAEGLSTHVKGFDENGTEINVNVVTEKPLTLYLNNQEIVTMMTIGDHPDLLAIGYLLNQHMLKADDEITAIDYDDDVGVVVVRTKRQTNYEETLKKKTRTSGCAQGTVFGDIMDGFDDIVLNNKASIKSSNLYKLTKTINTTPSLYLSAGAIHGCVLCQDDKALVYMEDVGRHNAVDKIAGWMHMNSERADNKTFYTTGRLTSEMVIKTVMMGIPILVSRSGFTAWGVELAKRANLTLIGRARGKRFTALSGHDRIIRDLEVLSSDDEDTKYARKGSQND
ncbi:Sulfur carrier protein FdhD [Nymphon striatum]|nr:Sulfur carrier protein FdhD [Nymphon striatum]